MSNFEENYKLTQERLRLVEGNSEVEDLKSEIKRLTTLLTRKNLELEKLQRFARNSTQSRDKAKKTDNKRVQVLIKEKNDKIKHLGKMLHFQRNQKISYGLFVKFIKKRVIILFGRQAWIDLVNCTDNPLEFTKIEEHGKQDFLNHVHGTKPRANNNLTQS